MDNEYINKIKDEFNKIDEDKDEYLSETELYKSNLSSIYIKNIDQP